MENLPLIPQLLICFISNCSTIKLTDITGFYDSENNVGGYGADTYLPENATAATLVVTSPDGTETSINLLEYVNNYTLDTNINEMGTHTLTSYSDGEYHFLYTITFDDISFTYETYIFSVCSVRCCVDKLWAKVATSAINSKDCFCGDLLLKKALQAEALFKSIENASICGNEVRQPLLEKLEKICKLEKCNCK